MFTGIIEALGEIVETTKNNDNLDFTIKSEIASQLKIDQSVAHNGVCLTVVDVTESRFRVTAISETLEKSNLGSLVVGQSINLERSLKLGDRLDGHIVQGHVDLVANCIGVEEQGGSWLFSFSYDSSSGNLTIEKGSITVNGVSLTVVNSKNDQFSVAVIPYTYSNTTFKYLKKGDPVNLEFDVIGKYVSRLLNK